MECFSLSKSSSYLSLTEFFLWGDIKNLHFIKIWKKDVPSQLKVPMWVLASSSPGIWVAGSQRHPFQGLRVGSCLTLRNELLQGTQVLTEQEAYWKGAPGWGQQGQGTQKSSPTMRLQFYGNAVSWRVVSGPPFWLRVLPGGTPHLPARMDSSVRDSGR